MTASVYWRLYSIPFHSRAIIPIPSRSIPNSVIFRIPILFPRGYSHSFSFPFQRCLVEWHVIYEYINNFYDLRRVNVIIVKYHMIMLLCVIIIMHDIIAALSGIDLCIMNARILKHSTCL